MVRLETNRLGSLSFKCWSKTEVGNAETSILGNDRIAINATDYHDDKPSNLCRERLDSASLRSYGELKARHLAEYRRFFRRLI